MFVSLNELAIKTKMAARELAVQSTQAKNEALELMAQALLDQTPAIIAANEKDLASAEDKQMAEHLKDRLMINAERIQGMAEGLRELIALKDPIGEYDRVWKTENGMKIAQVRVPMGLIAMIYEARPNVTVDAVGLCLKSGNAVLLRGSSSAYETNLAIVKVLKEALAGSQVGADFIGFVESKNRDAVTEILTMNGVVDLAIPRGGAGLIQHVVKTARIPVIETGVGNCHLYVHEAADFDKALNILINGKTQRPSVCNALETLVVDEAIAEAFLAQAVPALKAKNVGLYGCAKAQALIPEAEAAGEKDFSCEYLDLKIAIKIVSGFDEAIAHIQKYSSGHSEVIVTENISVAENFTRLIDSACVYVNASSRFSDGQQFGFGAEIGISTQKMHARGPMGLQALTSYKYIIIGEGQVRV